MLKRMSSWADCANEVSVTPKSIRDATSAFCGLEDEEAGGEPAILAAQRVNFVCDVREDVGVGHSALLERGNAIASIVIICLKLLPGETGFVEEGEVRALRAMAIEPEPDVA